MNATRVLARHQHTLVNLLGELERDRDLRVSLLLELVDELTVYLASEAQFFYGELAAVVEVDLEARYTSHAQLRNGLRNLVHAEPDDGAFDRALAKLSDDLAAHAAADEATIFPAAERAIEAHRLVAIGQGMLAFRERITARNDD